MDSLNVGKKVCVAIPRRDVVIELFDRFKYAFPKSDVVKKHGGSFGENFGDIVICTTHQLINYYKEFDFIIVDEVDAFPYYNNEMLYRFVNKSIKDKSSTIFMSATPKKDQMKLIKKGIVKSFTIPIRYHGFLLCLPKVKYIGNWEKDIALGIIPVGLKRWIDNKLGKKKIMVFVPKIKVGKLLWQLFVSELYKCCFVYSESIEKHNVLKKFRNDEYDFLITTTILERGVTISNLDVCVIGVEDLIFDESALVQISGRVGRKEEYPSGDVMFFYKEMTTSVIKAIAHIEKMNKLARDFIK